MWKSSDLLAGETESFQWSWLWEKDTKKNSCWDEEHVQQTLSDTVKTDNCADSELNSDSDRKFLSLKQSWSDDDDEQKVNEKMSEW